MDYITCALFESSDQASAHCAAAKLSGLLDGHDISSHEISHCGPIVIYAHDDPGELRPIRDYFQSQGQSCASILESDFQVSLLCLDNFALFAYSEELNTII
jgi:hypothetical protein